MLARLIRKAEVPKEYERGQGQQPAEHLEVETIKGYCLPNGGWDLNDVFVVAVIVCFLPAFPPSRMRVYNASQKERCQRNGTTYFGEGKSH